MIIRQYTEFDRDSWQDLLENSSYRRLPHELGYSEWISETYGYRPVNLVAEGRQGLEAIFPAFIWKQWGKPRQLLSVPFFEYGGPVLKGDTNKLSGEFISALLEWSKNNGYEAVRLIGAFDMDKAIVELLRVQRKKITEIGILRLAEPNVLWKRIKYSVRKNINKAKTIDLSVLEDHSIATFRVAFYPLYLKTMQRFGTPPHPFSYYESLVKSLGSVTRLWTAYFRDQPIACLLGFSTGTTTHIVSTVSSRDYWGLRPNDLLHWEAIISSAREGREIFDFGLMRYKGQIDYKEKWGIEKFPYYESNISQSKRSFKSIFQDVGFFALLWRNLVPLRITPYLGRPIRRIFVR